MNTTAETCPTCNTSPAEVLCFTTVRGKGGTSLTGRVLFKGSMVCEDCAECFETPTDGE